MFKKLIALLLALVMILSIAACSEKTDKKDDQNNDEKTTASTEEVKDAVVKQALALIDDGDIQGAYDLLWAIDNRNEEQEEMFKKFVWVKTEETHVQDGNTIYSLKSSYNLDGYLVSCDVVSEDDNTSEKMVYDKDNNLLSYKEGSHNIVHTYDQKGNMLTSKYGEHITEEFTYYSNGQLKSYTYKTPDNAAVLYSIYGPQLFTVPYDKNGNVLSKKRVSNNGEESWHETIYTYDKNGNVLTEDYTDSSGDWYKYVYSYDNKGNLLTVVATNVYVGGQGERTSYTTTYTYDKNNNVLTEHTSSSDGTWTKKVYTYDKSGNVLTETDTDNNGKNITITNTYDKNSNILKTESSESTTTYSYDKNGNKLSQYHITKNGSWTKESFTYDEAGRILTRDYSYSYSVDFSGHWEKEVYTYTKNGKLLTSSVTKSTGEYKYISNTYDEQGRITSHSESSNSYTETPITYTYDQDGNQTYEEFGYIWTCDKYGNAIKADFISGSVDEFGLTMFNFPDKSYSYELFYYPDGAPWVLRGSANLISNPRTEFSAKHPVTGEIAHLPTSNFYYSFVLIQSFKRWFTFYLI